jgi:hypothetical protein
LGSDETEFICDGPGGLLTYRPRRANISNKIQMDPEGDLLVAGNSSDGSSKNLIRLSALGTANGWGGTVSIQGDKVQEYIELSAADGWLIVAGQKAQLYAEVRSEGIFEFKLNQNIEGAYIRFDAVKGGFTVSNTKSNSNGTVGVALDGFTGEVKSFDNNSSYYNTTSPYAVKLSGSSSSTTLEAGSLTCSGGASAGTVWMSASSLPKGVTAYFQQIDVCVDGKTKKAWVLMSDPKD